MAKINYKLQKYIHKLKKTDDKSKILFYKDKIEHYQKMLGGINLMQPQKLKGKYPDLNIDADKIITYGYGLLTPHKNLEPVIFERRSPYPNDIVIEILYAGICHSDWHYIVGEWKSNIPLVPGHEICGRVVRLGSSVTKFKIGDIVLVGTYVNSCRQCSMCELGRQQYCDNGVSSTYNSIDRLPYELIATGEPTYGGFSSVITVNEDFVFDLPKNLPAKVCAPLVCAGVTTFSALRQMNIEPGQKIAIAGIGGLGHLAVKIAKDMGAYVVALTTTKWKLDDAIRLGADESILMTEKINDKYYDYFDFILDTIPVNHALDEYINLLSYNGTLWTLGYFGQTEINTNDLASKNKSIRSSIVGGVNEIKEMLDYCSNNEIYPDVEFINIINVNKTYNRLLKSDVKYRFVIDLTKNT